MPGRGKKFISDKNPITYRLVRCSRADGHPSGYTFVRVDETKREKFSMKLPPCASHPSLKEILNQKKQVPLDGSQSELDLDIAAALDDDDLNPEDFENALEDDFISMAMANDGIQASNKLENNSENEDSDDEPSVSGDEDEGSFDFDGDEENPNLTKHSLTSTVEQLDEFMKLMSEKFFCGTYDDDQIGALAFEEIEGSCKPDKETVRDLVEHCVEYKKELYPYENNIDDDLKHKIRYYAEASSDEETPPEEEEDEKSTKYDCESIKCTYSNIHNRPTVIKAEKKEKQIPANLWKQTLTKSNLRQLCREGGVKEEVAESATLKNKDTVFSSWNGRQKNETAEEKKLRKQAHKQHKRESRIIKKKNKLAFKEEEKRERAVVMNANKNKFVSLC